MMKSRSMVMLATVTLAAMAGVYGCSDDNKNAPAVVADSGATPAGDSSTTATTGSITGTVTFNGSAVGPLNIAIFTDFPPSGPPAAIQGVASKTWPGTATYDLKNVPAGEYFVTGFIFQGSGMATGPGPNDPSGIYGTPAPTKVKVVAGQAAKADFELSAPPPADAGADAPSDG